MACSSKNPEVAQSAASSIQYAGEKPRAFNNIGESCWINAAIQALLSPMAFKAALAKLWAQTPVNTRAGLTQAASNGADTLENFSHQLRLAATMCVTHRHPRTAPLTPHLFTKAFYQFRQDDAGECITRVLHPKQAPVLQDLVSGDMEQQLTCTFAGCQATRPSRGEKDFASLQLPLCTPCGTQTFRSVQAALDAYMPSEIVSLSEDRCQICIAAERPAAATDNFLKSHAVVRFPKVLVVSLNRWVGHSLQDALLHQVEATQYIHFQTCRYRLCAVVCHLGLSPHAGHYVTVARHATAQGEWWFYDDSSCVPASAEQITTLCTHGHWGELQSYILLYELSDAADPTAPVP